MCGSLKPPPTQTNNSFGIVLTQNARSDIMKNLHFSILFLSSAMLSRYFLHLKALFPEQKKDYYFDEELVQFVHYLARQEKRPVEDVTAGLIAIALDRRLQAQQIMRIWNTLTPREQQVAALICLKYNSRAIAIRLGIAPETVRTHLRNLLSKFHLNTKIGLRLSMRVSSGWDLAAWEAANFDPHSAPFALTKVTTDRPSNKVRYSG